MNSSKKVAIIQNRIQAGGRLHVIIAIIKILNDMGIEPEILTLKSRISKPDILGKYGKEIKFTIREILWDVRIPFEFHIILFNFLCRFYLNKYDLVINSNNVSFLLPQKINLISYIHYPRKDRLLSEYVSIHFPGGAKKSPINPFHIFDNIAALLYKFNRNINQKERVVANSQFCAEAIRSNYPNSINRISVIYPPVKIENSIKFDITQKSNKQVVSIGRYASDKRQMEQIRIAGQLKDFTFHIMGFAKPKDPYLNKCKKYIEEKNITNVQLHPNIDYDNMQSIMNKSLFFIHNLRNEPFGITTVQAIASGCIPVVHNSGGQKEIVNHKYLRFESVIDAVRILGELSKMEWGELEKIQRALRENIKLFDENEFNKKMKDVLIKHLE